MPQRTRGQDRFAFGTTATAGDLIFDLRALEIFVCVVECGSMTHAAQRLGLTQSGVSHAVATLEKSLGIALLDRRVRPIAATAGGRVLLDRAEVLLREARETAVRVRASSFQAVPRLRVAMADSVVSTVGPHLVTLLHQEAAQWSIWSGLSLNHIQSLAAREVDLILTSNARIDGTLYETHELFSEPYVVALPHTFGSSIENLRAIGEKLNLVRYSARSLTGQDIEQYLRRLRIEAAGRFEFDTSDAVLGMVAAGLGWAITTPFCILQSAAHIPRLRLEPLPVPRLRRTLFVAAHHDELSDLPLRIARATREIVETRCKPAISAWGGWVADEVRVPV
ncbi:LysR family transcriptional regulator [Aquabacter spiritensis]|uniref:DNA-binding transcriptional LysR family regulator n=1 Tax=Aquabacter spiritensis TaxID=933073 RepID=A0A4R3M444_9HYPH|nr:LysR family transcriptional regulator [Aquabacter spiritensis]TCT07812.1 DNA-binding transcriptional LysR family regulator [Aquabacter spiritensis]